MAKIHKEAVKYTADTLASIVARPMSAVFIEEYKNRGLRFTRFLWDMYHAADAASRRDGYTCLFAGEQDKVSWKDGAKFLFPGEINDGHIETAMRAVAKLLGVYEDGVVEGV